MNIKKELDEFKKLVNSKIKEIEDNVKQNKSSIETTTELLESYFKKISDSVMSEEYKRNIKKLEDYNEIVENVNNLEDGLKTLRNVISSLSDNVKKDISSLSGEVKHIKESYIELSVKLININDTVNKIDEYISAQKDDKIKELKGKWVRWGGIILMILISLLSGLWIVYTYTEHREILHQNTHKQIIKPIEKNVGDLKSKIDSLGLNNFKNDMKINRILEILEEKK